MKQVDKIQLNRLKKWWRVYWFTFESQSIVYRYI